jgi:hypothetical protein
VLKPEPLKLKVIGTQNRRIEVVEAPPMAGLRLMKGTINVTVQLTEDPQLPELPLPLPALPPDDPAVLSRMAEFRQKHQALKLAFVSATVYDHKRTLIRCYPNGCEDKEISAWSNLDFNCFCGFGKYEAKGENGEVQTYGLMMGIGNEDTQRISELLKKHSKTYAFPEVPKLPNLADGGPAFVVIKGDASDPEAMAVITGMHDHYRAEGSQMEEAYRSRLKVDAERRTYLLAHPLLPEDVSIQIWKREPSGEAAHAQFEKGDR